MLWQARASQLAVIALQQLPPPKKKFSSREQKNEYIERSFYSKGNVEYGSCPKQEGRVVKRVECWAVSAIMG